VRREERQRAALFDRDEKRSANAAHVRPTPPTSPPISSPPSPPAYTPPTPPTYAGATTGPIAPPSVTPPYAGGPPHLAGSKSDPIERLRELAGLRDAGVLTQAEFEAAKARVLADL
jgi:hypothetical protein